MRALTPECKASLAMFIDRQWQVAECRITHADVGGNPVLTIVDRIPCRCIAPARGDCVGCDGGFWPRTRRYSVLPFGSFAPPMGGIENCTPLDEDAAAEWYQT